MMADDTADVKGITDVKSPNDFLLLLNSRWKCLNIREISGATGDLGTFLPLLLNMATASGNSPILNFSSALFWAGVANIVTGMIWDSPIPVQPMKTIAAVAITEDLTGNEMIGAGLSVSIVVFLLGQTGLIETINYLTPISIVRGLQLGLGITMAVKGIDLMTELPFAKDPDSILLTIACLAFTLLALSLRIKKKKYIPAALVLVVVGLLIAIVRTFVNGNAQGRPGVFVKLTVSDLTFRDLLNGFWKAGFAQLPLTTLNSVVSICDLNNENYFKNDASKKMTRRSVARSVGLMNLLTLPFGSIPMCHGAGGLAAQYQFGARGGASILFLGIMKVLFSILAGSTASTFLGHYPNAILGVLLFFSGLGLSKAGISNLVLHTSGDDRHFSELMIILATAASTVALKTGWGCFFGICFSLFYGGFDHVWEDLKERNFCCWTRRQKKDLQLPVTLQKDDDEIRATKGNSAA